ncbi:unnamed protein product [Cunninghamella blakesleeana]
MSIQKKKEEAYLNNIINTLLRLPENKRCFDCSKMSPSFVNMTIQTFICLRCSGLVREVGHRVKSVSSSFSKTEVIGLKLGGNNIGKNIWLHHYHSPHCEMPVLDDDNSVRLNMRQKYYENKWLNKSLLLNHNETIKQTINDSLKKENDDTLLPKISTKKLNTTTTTNNNNTSTGSLFLLPPPPSSPIKNIPIKQQKQPSLDVLLTPNDDDIPLGLVMGLPQKLNPILSNQVPPSPLSPTNHSSDLLLFNQNLEPLSPTNHHHHHFDLLFNQKVEPLSPTSPLSSTPLSTTTSNTIQSLDDPFVALRDLAF